MILQIFPTPQIQSNSDTASSGLVLRDVEGEAIGICVQKLNVVIRV